MQLFRKVIFWCHLTAGAAAGIVILIMSVTGVLLTYERQIQRWADVRGYNVSRPAADAARLPVETLISEAQGARRAAPSGVTLYGDAASPATVSFPGGRILYVNPYTGEALGEGSPRVRAFFRGVTDWHRWLGASGEGRNAARAVTGASNLVFLFIVASGFYLWWPRRWTRKSVRAVTWFRRGQGGKARDFNWHNVIGFWSAAPLFVVVLSGVVISYTWASNLVYRLAGEEPPIQQQRGGPPGGQQQQQTNAPAVPLEGLDILLVKAEQQVEGWRSITLQLPQKPDAPVTFAIDRGNGGQPHLRSQLALDRATGEVLRWEPASSNTAGRRLRSWLRFAHTGEVYGLLGQTIAGLVSLGGAFLVYTGLSLACRRFYAWRGRRSREQDVPEGVQADA
ncbi:MAG TPA: PepSY-associated TM helix domain-containing protein [Pyrinomonadaceae bacterium]|nr:PepSY-associated TM helix domain-containing protein [Pyrinomonadaceae bacterium]